MATLENSLDSIPCRHCGSPVRPGMIRCRECNGLLAEPDNEFVLSPKVAVKNERTCARCGTVLEPGIDDCPSCASALLDDLLKGPGEEAPAPGTGSRQFQSTSELRPRSSAAPAANPPSEWVPLREVPTPAPKARGNAPAAKTGKPGSTDKPSRNLDDDPPGLFDDDEPAPAPRKETARPMPKAATKPEPEEKEGEVETSAACSALLASLATADTNLRVEIATALGKLGDKAARGPLERHLVDPDVRVRRAVAEALVLLGHPKGESLLEIAERKPAAAVISAAKPAAAHKPKRTGGGMQIDGAAAKKLGVAVVAIGIAAGGIWFFMSGSSGSAAGPKKRSKKKKSAAVVQQIDIAARPPFSIPLS